jgi:hypothetical protein
LQEQYKALALAYEANMRLLLVSVIALAIVLDTDALSLYNATEWRSVSSFTATNGNSYTIYKPVCTGKTFCTNEIHFN